MAVGEGRRVVRSAVGWTVEADGVYRWGCRGTGALAGWTLGGYGLDPSSGRVDRRWGLAGRTVGS